jgi:hypothetical protein
MRYCVNSLSLTYAQDKDAAVPFEVGGLDKAGEADAAGES